MLCIASYITCPDFHLVILSRLNVFHISIHLQIVCFIFIIARMVGLFLLLPPGEQGIRETLRFTSVS
jgi:hypothetical protein